MKFRDYRNLLQVTSTACGGHAAWRRESGGSEMKSCSHLFKKTMRSTALLVFLLSALTAFAQSPTDSPSDQQLPSVTPGEPKELNGVPILTGYSAFNSSFTKGQQELEPVIAPILLVPIGQKVLIEAEGEFSGSYTHATGEPWDHSWDKGLEYAQINWFAHRYLTVVGGRYLTPFGILNERLHPAWIKNIQTLPLISALEMSSGNGGELRGGIPLSSKVDFNYSAYFSAPSQVTGLVASRMAGTRFSMFIPGARVEIGTSFQRSLQDERFNTYGMDLTWQLKPIPLEIRGEYAGNNVQGKGYWLEGAYRLRRIHKRFVRNSQAVVRMEQFFTPSSSDLGGGGMGDVPDVNTQRLFAGWNYYINDGFKVSAAYGRQFSSDGDRNLWTLGITYRWIIPFGGRGK